MSVARFFYFPPNKLWQLVIEEHYLYLLCVVSLLQHVEVHVAQHVIFMRTFLRASVLRWEAVEQEQNLLYQR